MHSLIRASAASTPAMIAILDDAAIIAHALAFERALAHAEAAEGLLPPAAADLIETCCTEPMPVEVLAHEAAFAGTLAIPLVAMLRARVAEVEPDYAGFVHCGGTSQDLADTAMMLQAKTAVALILEDGKRFSDALAILTRRHATTPMAGRTLLQHALPITFGLKTSQWLLGFDAALDRVEREATNALVLGFGGATGSLAGLDGRGTRIAERLATMLGLAVPPAPWHARRGDIAGLGSALAILIGCIGKIARDVALMAQNEIGEAFEPKAEGRGGSSAMAHKRNPTGCQVALSAALRAPGLASTLIVGLPQEHERGLGGWQAEAPVLADLFGLAHGSIDAMLAVVSGLEVDVEAMARNLAAAAIGGDMGESVDIVARALRSRERDT